MEKQVLLRAKVCQRMVEDSVSITGSLAQNFISTAYADVIAGVGTNFALNTQVFDGNGAPVATTNGEAIIGAKDGSAYSLHITIKTSLLCEKIAMMKINQINNISCILKLGFHNSVYTTESQGFVYFIDEKSKPLGHLANQKNPCEIDLSSVLRTAFRTYCNGGEVSDIIFSLNHSGGLTYTTSTGVVAAVMEFASFYLGDATNVTNRPFLVISDISCPLPEESPRENISVGQIGTTTICYADQSVTHSIPLGNIRIAGQTAPFVLRYDPKVRAWRDDAYGFGSGWTCNFCQRLVRGEFYNPYENGYISYLFDGEGKRHGFIERWYYEMSGKKTYVRKETVFKKEKDQLFYTDSAGVEHEVKIERKGEDGLTLITARSQNYVSKEDDFVDWPNSSITLSFPNKVFVLHLLADGLVSVPHFYVANFPITTLERGFVNPQEVSFDTSSTPARPYILEDGQKKYLATETIDVPYFVTGASSAKVLMAAKEVSLSGVYNRILFRSEGYDVPLNLKKEHASDANDSHYANEDLQNVRAKIANYEAYRDERMASSVSLKNSIYEASEDIERFANYAKAFASQEQVPAFEVNSNNASLSSMKRHQDETEALIGGANESLAEILLKISELKEEEAYLRTKSESEATDFVLDETGRYWAFDYLGNLLGMGEGDKTLLSVVYKDGKILRFVSDEESVIIKRNETTGAVDFVMPDGKTIQKTLHLGEVLFTWTGGGKAQIDGGISLLADGSISSVTEGGLSRLLIDRRTSGQFTITRSVGTGIPTEDDEESDDTLTDISETIVFGQSITRHDLLRNVTTSYYLDGQKRLVNQSDGSTNSFYRYGESGIEDEVHWKSGNLIDSLAGNIDGTKKIASRVFTYNEITANYQGRSVPLGQSFCIILTLDKSAVSTPTNFSFDFSLKQKNGETTRKEFKRTFTEITNGVIVVPFALSSLADRVYVEAKLNEGESVFTGTSGVYFALYACEAVSQEFDGEGRLILRTDGSSKTSYSQFDGMNPTVAQSIYFDGRSDRSEYRYDAKNRLVFNEDGFGVCHEKRYDEKDRLIEEKSYPREDPSLSSISVSSYEDDKNQVISQGQIRDKDGELPEEIKTYSNHGQLRSLQKLNGSVEAYGYDPYNGAQTSLTEDANGLANTTCFGYRLDFLEKLENHGVTITYSYDGRHRPLNIEIASTIIGRYTYTDCNGTRTTDTVAFSQGSYSAETVRDNQGLVTRTSDNDGEETYYYNSDKRLQQKNWIGLGQTENFVYEWDGRILSDTIAKNGVVGLKKVYTYHNPRCLATVALTYQGADWGKTSYSYDPDDLVHEWVVDATLRQGTTTLVEKTFTRDALGRAKTIFYDVKAHAKAFTECFDYLQQGERNLSLVKHHSLSGANVAIDDSDYVFDPMGNIIGVKQNENETRYAFDGLNRLIREDNPYWHKTYRYFYDAGGNLLSRKEYPYSEEEELSLPSKIVTYVYPKEGWRDQLLSYDGQSCAYDSYGRPTLYRGTVLAWSPKGTLLNYGGNAYGYDRDGLRVSKTVSSVTTTYIRHGTQLLESVNSSETMLFHYLGDELVGFSLNGKEYLYGKNAQGDIIAVLDSDTLALLARYVYDSWGNEKVLNPDGTENLTASFIGHKNPFRYRGYFFDEETGLYYLNARYYDPQVGRFLTPDSLSVLDSTRAQVNGLNLYMYCADNPVMNQDPSGEFLISLGAALIAGAIIGGIVGGTFGGLTAVANHQNVWAGIFIGLVTGAIMGAGSGAGAFFIGTGTALGVVGGLSLGAATGFGGGFANDVANQAFNNNWRVDWRSAAWSGLEYSVLNTLSTALGVLGGNILGSFGNQLLVNGSLDFVFDNVTSSIGFCVDALRSYLGGSGAQTDPKGDYRKKMAANFAN